MSVGITAQAEFAHTVTSAVFTSARTSSAVLFAQVVDPPAPATTFVGVIAVLLIQASQREAGVADVHLLVDVHLALQLHGFPFLFVNGTAQARGALQLQHRVLDFVRSRWSKDSWSSQCPKKRW